MRHKTGDYYTSSYPDNEATVRIQRDLYTHRCRRSNVQYIQYKIVDPTSQLFFQLITYMQWVGAFIFTANSCCCSTACSSVAASSAAMSVPVCSNTRSNREHRVVSRTPSIYIYVVLRPTFVHHQDDQNSNLRLLSSRCSPTTSFFRAMLLTMSEIGGELLVR